MQKKSDGKQSYFYEHREKVNKQYINLQSSCAKAKMYRDKNKEYTVEI